MKTINKPDLIKYSLIYISTVLYLFLFYDYGINLWDEGILPNGTMRTLAGEVSGKDFLAYTSGRYFLLSFFFHSFGSGLLIFRKVILFLTAFMPLFGYLISKKIMNSFFSFIVFLLILSAPAVYYNRFFPFFTLLNMLFIVRYFNDSTKNSLISVIISIVITFCFRIEIGIISVVTLLACEFIKRIFMLKKGFQFRKPIITVVIASLFFLFVLTSMLAKEFLNSIPYMFYLITKTHDVWGNAFPDIFSMSYSFFEFIENLLFYLPLVVYTITLIISIRKIIFKKENQSFYLNILSITLLGIGTFCLVIWRAGLDNLIRVLPAFYILGLYLLSLCYNKLEKQMSDFSFPALQKTVPGLLTVSIPALLIYNFTMNHGFYVGSIGALRENTKHIKLKKADIFANPQEAGWTTAIVKYIQRNTDKKDYIFAVPLNPIWYFLSGRRNPTYYEWILPGSLKNPIEEQKKIITNLQQKKPKLVILADIAIDGREERKFSNYASQLYIYIRQNYKIVKQIAFFTILELKQS